MRHENNRFTPIGKRAHRSGEFRARRRVEALGGLVKEEHLGVREQKLRKRKFLLLAARKVIRVARGQPFKPEALRHSGSFTLSIAAASRPLHKLLTHRIAYEQRLRVLRK